MRTNTLLNRQTVLVDTNIGWLRQALSIVDTIDDKVFATSPPAFAPHRVGSHLRHILEFYECFLNALVTSHIDYEARRRDEAVENDRSAAADRICSIIDRLETTPLLRSDCIVWVR